jgi:hypothetical protein
MYMQMPIFKNENFFLLLNWRQRFCFFRDSSENKKVIGKEGENLLSVELVRNFKRTVGRRCAGRTTYVHKAKTPTETTFKQGPML